MKTMTEQRQHVELVREMYDAFNRGDVEAIARNVTPDGAWQLFTVSLDTRGLRRGPSGTRQFFENLARVYHFDHCTPRQFLAEGNTVVVLGDMRARVNENGRLLEMSFVHVFRMKGGNVDDWRGYEEPEKVIEAHTGPRG